MMFSCFIWGGGIFRGLGKSWGLTWVLMKPKAENPKAEQPQLLNPKP